MRGEENKDSDKENEILDMILSTKFKDVILTEPDDGRGNTVLHVACEMHCLGFADMLLKAGSDTKAKNLKDQTPEDMVDLALADFKERIDCPKNQRVLERLNKIKKLF